MIVTQETILRLKTVNNGFTGETIKTLSRYLENDSTKGWARRILGVDVPDDVLNKLFKIVEKRNAKILSERKEEMTIMEESATQSFINTYLRGKECAKDPYIVTSEWYYNKKIDWSIVKEEILKLSLAELKETGYWKTLFEWKALCALGACKLCGNHAAVTLRYQDYSAHHGSELKNFYYMDLVCSKCAQAIKSSR